MKLLTLARDLRRRKAREKHSLFVAEGVRAIEELLRSGITIQGALVAPQLADAPRGAALRSALTEARIETAEVSERDFRSAAETDSPQGVLAIGTIPGHTLATLRLPELCRVLVLDAVQDPGNVGTILRTAAAMGAAATIALPGTVDIWNPKVIRGSMGAQFHHIALHATLGELREFIAREKLDLWAAEAAGDPLSMRDAPPRLAIAVGNEGAGLSPELRPEVRRSISIPIRNVESLNVAVATGIILYELRQ